MNWRLKLNEKNVKKIFQLISYILRKTLKRRRVAEKTIKQWEMV
jgi:hypothetical protein